MDLIFGVILVIGTILAIVFNYYLNKAPGSDPEDFKIGPEKLGLKCDCYLNTIIVAGIAALAVSAASTSFDTRLDFYIIAIAVFAFVTLAGIIGRRHRYRDWKEMAHILKRSVPTMVDRPTGSVDYVFDDDDKEQFDEE
ncbi:MAG: hypothetical protein KAQ65_11960 [Candidatus Thorarchaeota archaeon]|nr:hypothetical protein [Candidatus Thorarchaeota archaeon]